MTSEHFILADGRWSGAHGIGRFSQEILSRLQHTTILTQGPSPLSIKNLYWLPYELTKQKNQQQVFFSPGFIPPIYSSIPFVFTIHDLIHLHSPGKNKYIKKIFYDVIIKSATHRAHKIITVSEYSKNQIISWANVTPEKIIVVKNGISSVFSSEGDKHLPGYPYFLYVGNSKPHKNLPHLIKSFSHAKIDSRIKLVLTATITPALKQLIQNHSLENRIIFTKTLTENELANYYRGAIALIFPSLYEGFGLPVVEAMASGIPVITSNVTSLPEITGNAAILVNPIDLESLSFHIEQMISNPALRQNLITKGIQQAKNFSWDNTANIVQNVLDETFMSR
jgi:glycosyltransferase involved in cell wall biosynthesis